MPTISDVRNLRSIDRAARAYCAGPVPVGVCLAVAVIVDSPLSRVIGNIFLGLNKPRVPLRLFSDVSEAEAWLKGGAG